MLCISPKVRVTIHCEDSPEWTLKKHMVLSVAHIDCGPGSRALPARVSVTCSSSSLPASVRGAVGWVDWATQFPIGGFAAKLVRALAGNLSCPHSRAPSVMVSCLGLTSHLSFGRGSRSIAICRFLSQGTDRTVLQILRSFLNSQEGKQIKKHLIFC